MERLNEELNNMMFSMEDYIKVLTSEGKKKI